MILRFVEGGGWDSHIIRWDTRCHWSHVECMSQAGPLRTFGAQLNGGVKWRDLTDPAYKGAVNTETHIIRCAPEAEAAFWKFLGEQDGKPYDWRAIVSFGLGSRDWRELDSWFCSELMSRALEVAGLLTFPDDIPVWRLTPRDLWLLLAGIKSEEEK